MSVNEDEAEMVVQTPVLSLPPAELASSQDWSRSPLSRCFKGAEAPGHVSGGGFGFIREGSSGDVATSFSIADGYSHPRGRGQVLLRLPVGTTGEQELKMQRSMVEHFETRPRA